MEILQAESTNLFIGTEDDPRQVVRVRIAGTRSGSGGPVPIRVDGDRLRSEGDLTIGPLARGEQARLEIGVTVDDPIVPGETRAAEVVIGQGTGTASHGFAFIVVEPGWRMFMVSHFHYDPVWWNTQAAYTETWGLAIQYRWPFQEPGLALVKAHLEMSRRDPDYKFVLAELDYLKPYWDVFPEDRDYIRQLLAQGRLELMGGAYNEPNTNLTSAESTIRNAIYGVAYQRDVLGGAPATAWQLDAFGHDPQFPGIMADAGISSSSWARGPFHEWGPHWVRGPARTGFESLAHGDTPEMQFATEFDWVAPSGTGLLTSFMANHYSAGWWMDAATTLEAAELEVHRLFSELAVTAATKNVLLPVGTDYTPPNKWLTAIHRDWARRYVWPKFVAAIPREFFAAVREERARTGRPFVPQSRDMNPVYTGKDVSFIDTKQAQRVAENTLLAAEKFASIAMLLGARFPAEAVDKAWRQILFGAHHDGITGSESDQVYLDLLGGWREALELGKAALAGALDCILAEVDTTGEGLAVVVFNPLSWLRTDVVRVVINVPDGWPGIELRDDTGAPVPFAVDAVEQNDEGAVSRATLLFVAADVPSVGYRTFRAVGDEMPLKESAWRSADGSRIENEHHRVEVDVRRGGGIASLIDKRTASELVQPGRVANEVLVYREYANHPIFGEGPWHLTPEGRSVASSSRRVAAVVEESPIGRRIVLEAPFEGCRLRQEVVLWDGIERVEFRTRIDDYSGQDRLFRVRFPVALAGGRPIAEVGNAVVGRPFGFPNVDVAEAPFTLDNPAYNWFGLGVTARVDIVPLGGGEPTSRAFAVAEVVALDQPWEDAALRDLVVALVRQGVTSTTTKHDGTRYGVLHIDSNLPDLRIAIGRPSESRFVEATLDAAGPAFREELERQLAVHGIARLWVPANEADAERREPIPDLRNLRDLPVLVIAGADADRTVEAIEALAADLGDSVVSVEQPRELGTEGKVVEDHTVALLNIGLPGFNVEADGSLYLSLMRSCSGWPSGVWIDPPRRSAPDGSNFQFQHWSHTFDYALCSTPGDWRAGAFVQAGHAYNNPMPVWLTDGHPGDLPVSGSLLQVEPSSVVLTAIKPAGNPLARMAAAEADAGDGLVLRLYESSGRRTTAHISCRWPIDNAVRTNIIEDRSELLEVSNGSVSVALEPFEIATLRVRPSMPRATPVADVLAPRVERAQPVFSGYWLHNKGPAPMGNLPVSVHIRPWLLAGDGPFTVPVVVASERTDSPVAGTVRLVLPTGWDATPAERFFRLAPGAHLEWEASVTPAAGALAGRYFVAAQITTDAGQVHEDVVRIDLGSSLTGDRDGEAETSTPSLAAAVVRAVHWPVADGQEPPVAQPVDDVGHELDVALAGGEIRLTAGERTELRVSVRNLARSEIRGEAQLLSPHETWTFITPWTQGFAVASGEERTLTFDIGPSFDGAGGSYWALVKVMYFGRVWYTESVRVTVVPAPGVVTRGPLAQAVGA